MQLGKELYTIAKTTLTFSSNDKYVFISILIPKVFNHGISNSWGHALQPKASDYK